MTIKNIKVYLPDASTLEEDSYLEGAFRLTVDENGKILSVITENKQLLIVGTDCEIYRKDEDD